METSIYQVDHIITIQDPLELASILNMNCSQFANVICKCFRSLYGFAGMTTNDFQSLFKVVFAVHQFPLRIHQEWINLFGGQIILFGGNKMNLLGGNKIIPVCIDMNMNCFTELINYRYE